MGYIMKNDLQDTKIKYSRWGNLNYTRELLYEIQAICGDNHYAIYSQFEPGWLTYDRRIVDQIMEELYESKTQASISV